MITKLLICDQRLTDPYGNLALEQYLTEHVQTGECILYLWQNARTVVIGRNQNAWRECDAEALRADSGRVARRLSGGGAVFHDMGNLNFTFIMSSEDFDTERQLSVIIRACASFGIKAQMTGRNDLVVAGAGGDPATVQGMAAGAETPVYYKFSGNAFYHHGGKSYHHGTILIDTDTALMGRYLRPHPEKLKAKGVGSVRSRVINLIELNPAVTVDGMREAMKKAFLEVYGPCHTGDDHSACAEGAEADRAYTCTDAEDIMRRPEFAALHERYKSDAWNLEALPGGGAEESRGPAPDGKHSGLARPAACDYETSRTEKFDWGLVEICLKVRENKVVLADIYTDSMETEWTLSYKEAFEGVKFTREGITEAADKGVKDGDRVPERIAADIKGMVDRLCGEVF